MWERLKNHIPHEIKCNFDGAIWTACGFCDTWKWSKYIPKHGKDAFAAHVDGTHWPQLNTRSFYSVNIYLNDDFKHGATRFYTSTSSGEIDYQCHPQQGMGLLFRQPPSHRYLHDGEGVQEGTKYLLRCDIMYRKHE